MSEQIWNGCAVPDDRLYDLELHVWVQLDRDEALLGMTDVAQTMSGRLVQISWKRTGRTLRRGQTVAVVESAKWVGPFPTPLSGELLTVNRSAYAEDIAIGNRDPYGAGWMARVAPTALTDERAHLADGAAAFEFYRDFTDDREIRCYRCAE
ncbi:glycine cleavage system protein H [Gordonia rhizosphera]|uniref:Glycine cleavage system H protein n=1 Tax=Gordonia rhizosphera NBRC 16068 TaxID=1108045 RepID=K6WHV7_9ACTN|nr:glycine cleavage system protein H [Gordonia rhizosphera]GAB91742.1 glycine cleavage system H protein [Gordonia rhizosphera NBRC 16068]